MSLIRLELPHWLENYAARSPAPLASSEERMRFVIRLAEENIQRAGGPFGAAVFDAQGQPIAVGVNLVEQGQCSILHAEMVALILAQQRLGRYDLSHGGQAFYELVTSTEPCAMCLGAIPWAGVRRVVCGARDENARAIGFDEGAKPMDWVAALADRGIEVVQDVLRAEAVALLRRYQQQGGHLYNAGFVNP